MSAAKIFAASAALCLGKTAILGAAVTAARLFTGTYINKEDAWWENDTIRKVLFFMPSHGGAAVAIEAEGGKNDVVERIKNAQRNDLENTLSWAVLSGLYLTFVQPSTKEAQWLFGGFAVARFAHSLFYVAGVQPFRSASFLAGWGIIVYEAVKVFSATKDALFN